MVTSIRLMRKRTLHALLVLGIVTIGTLAPASASRADGSVRCPGFYTDLLQPVTGAPPKVEPQFAWGKTLALWRGLYPGVDPSLGPLGCPLGEPKVEHGRVRQAFQRGFVYVGRESDLVEFVVAVRAIGRWFLWWGPSTKADYGVRVGKRFSPLGPLARPAVSPNHGLFATTFAGQGDTTLFICDDLARVCSKTTPDDPSTPWHALIDPLGFLPTFAAFDFSSRLGLAELQVPSSSSVQDRFEAALPPWLPCFVTPPNRGSSIAGENELAYLQLMMRRESPCPVTNQIPSDEAASWMLGEKLWAGRVPGTDVEGDFCSRIGDLDVDLMGILHILYEHPARYRLRAHLLELIKPWGGLPRGSPYATPGFDLCPVLGLETENHILLQETSRYLIDQLLVQQGKGSRDDLNASADFLLRYLALMVRRDLYEFNSIPYGRYDLKALYVLYDHAPLAAVRTAAAGVLDWMWAKLAVGENMRRSSRPYRRQPDPQRYGSGPWLSPAAEDLGLQAALLLGGGLNYLDMPVNVPLRDNEDPYPNFTKYPRLGTASENETAVIADVMDTGYTPPQPIASWFVDRYNGKAAQVAPQYVEVFNHGGGDSIGDPQLFLQANLGQEIYSGTRNFTITGGGSDVPPGMAPPPPSSGLGTVFDWLALGLGYPIWSDMVSGAVQDSALWDTQPGTMRETALIPTGGGLTRSQTLRFGTPHVARRAPSEPARLCVSAGFMCGFDMRWPTYPFPGALNAGSSHCRNPQLPQNRELRAAFDRARKHLGCLFESWPGRDGDWLVWTFPRGEIAFDSGEQPASEASWIASWVEGRDWARHVVVEWAVPEDPEDWFRVYGGGGNPDDNGADPLRIDGNPDNPTQHSSGRQVFDIPGEKNGTGLGEWRVRVWGCDYGSGLTHSSCSPMLRPLRVNIEPLPQEPFFCQDPEQLDDHPGYVGRVCSSAYPMYAFILNRPCGPDVGCIPGASSYGFVVAAPAGHLSMGDFRSAIESHMGSLSNPYAYPAKTNSVFVPYGTNALDGHEVTFQWTPDAGEWAIRGDRGPFRHSWRTWGRTRPDGQRPRECPRSARIERPTSSLPAQTGVSPS